jgi:hypothetical protein
MIKKRKGIGIDEFFYNTFEHSWFKCVFDPKIYEIFRM